MNERIFPEGLWPVMLTPFTGNKSIDFNALEELIEFYIAKGAAGLFANCLSSEMYQLSEEERETLVKAVIKTVDSRVPVIATGSFGDDLSLQVTNVKRIYDLGVNAVVLVTSHLVAEEEKDDILKKRFAKLLRATPEVPLGIYECPEPYKRLLSPEMTTWLAKTGRFYYFKDTSCNLKAIRKKLAAAKGTPMGLFNANTPTALESLKEGARGLSTISANFYPELYDSLCWIVRDPSQKKLAERLQRHLSIMDAVTRIKYPLSAKIFLAKRGLKIGITTRLGISPLNDEEKRMLDALYNWLQEILAEYDL